MTIDDSAGAGRAHAGRRYLRERALVSVDGLEHLVGGLGTALLSLAALLYVASVALLCLAGVGLLLAPSALRAARAVADRERARLTRWGPEVVGPGPVPGGLRVALREAATRRELGWLAVHATGGFAIGLVGLALPLYAVQSLTFPLWYRLLPPGSTGPGLAAWRIDGLADALAVGLTGIGWLAVVVGLGPGMARLQAWPGRRLLGP